jgi:Tfp pilus assembly protein PilV
VTGVVRARGEAGFMTVELMVSIVVITIALLAMMAAYDGAFASLHSSGQTSSAGLLAENQLELYASLPYSSVGLDTSTLNTVKSTDANYSTDEATLRGTGLDVTITGCGTSAQCSPVQTVTGADHHTYKVETFIRALTNPSETTWTEKVVDVFVRDLTQSGTPIVFKEQTAFDHGPSS